MEHSNHRDVSVYTNCTHSPVSMKATSGCHWSLAIIVETQFSTLCRQLFAKNRIATTNLSDDDQNLTFLSAQDIIVFCVPPSIGFLQISLEIKFSTMKVVMARGGARASDHLPTDVFKNFLGCITLFQVCDNHRDYLLLT